jgi:beta-N-acetylhexosaminidase
VGTVCGLALGAFAFGAVLGEETPSRPSAASRLSLGQLAGQRIVLGFPGTRVSAAVERTIRSGGVAGVVLFSGNLPDRATSRRLISALQAVPRPLGLRDPLLVMTDQEGGLVKRVDGPPLVSARAIGARGPAFAAEQGELTAASLRRLGVDVDLAPVLDVARPGGTIAATGRGFGSTPERVAATAVPFATGLQRGDVAATAKHFPGLGSARLNTDDAVQRIDLSRTELRAVDEAPYRRFVAAGGRVVMLSTAVYPALSPDPAAFSAAIATGELRRRLGFGGVSISDALDSVAARAFGDTAAVATATAAAGTDLLLYTDQGEAARARLALLRGLRVGTLSRAAFERSVDRVLRLRHALSN